MKGITLKIHILCFVLINSILLNLLCVFWKQALIDTASAAGTGRKKKKAWVVNLHTFGTYIINLDVFTVSAAFVSLKSWFQVASNNPQLVSRPGVMCWSHAKTQSKTTRPRVPEQLHGTTTVSMLYIQNMMLKCQDNNFKRMPFKYLTCITPVRVFIILSYSCTSELFLHKTPSYYYYEYCSYSKLPFFFKYFFSLHGTSLTFVGNLSCLMRVKHSSRKSSTTHSCQGMQYSRAALPIPIRVCSIFVGPDNGTWLPAFGVFNMRTDVKHAIAH